MFPLPPVPRFMSHARSSGTAVYNKSYAGCHRGSTHNPLIPSTRPSVARGRWFSQVASWAATRCRPIPLVLLVLAPATATADPDKAPPMRSELRARFEVRPAQVKAADGLTEAMNPDTGQKIYIHKEPVITARDVSEVRAVEDKEYKGLFILRLTLTREGAKRMEKFSATWLDKPLAVLVDGKVIWSGTVLSKLSKNMGLNCRKETAEQVVRAIKGR